MTKVNPQHVMALRRLTDLPVSECRDLLGAAGGDLVVAVQHLRRQPWCALNEVAVVAMLRESGVPHTPPEPRRPVILPDAEVVAELTACGAGVADYFLIGGLVCSVNLRGELMGCSIDDEDLAASAKAFLRRLGAPEYPSLQAYQEQRHAASGTSGESSAP
ncbi:---NA--- : [Gemmataceae bacterium]|nr:---NA--- : [Gemmataceae bacterium]VTU02020.1 ---NA--- : [Gemmataceae bacterium]